MCGQARWGACNARTARSIHCGESGVLNRATSLPISGGGWDTGVPLTRKSTALGTATNPTTGGLVSAVATTASPPDRPFRTRSMREGSLLG